MATILVTGASTGIGEACVHRLAAAGHTVYAGVRREADAERLGATSPAVRPVLLDVTDEQQVAEVGARVDRELGDGGLDGLVNNAGVGVGGPVEYLPLDEWRFQLEVNLIGQVAVTQAVLEPVRRAAGRLVFVGSLSGRISTPLMAPYGASKHAVEALGEALRHELRPWGIRTVVVEPGAVRTAIWEKGRHTADRLERSLPPIAVERYAPFIAAVRAGIEDSDQRGVPADRVARVVERALFASRPRARYPVGLDAKVAGVASRLLPDALRDPLVARLVGP